MGEWVDDAEAHRIDFYLIPGFSTIAFVAAIGLLRYLGCSHIQANFETAFYRSKIADVNIFEQWSAEGGLDHAQRVNASWK